MELTYPREIDEYLRTHTSREDPLLNTLAADTQANAVRPEMQTGHTEASLLAMFARLLDARLVIDIGTYTGYSALAIAAALPDEGRVITCDIDPVATSMARRYWSQSPHGTKIDLRMGPALETLASIDRPIDMVFIDADKENYVRYWEACLPKVRSGGLLIADNVLWSGKVLNPQHPLDYAIVAFNTHVRYDDRVSAVMIPLRDGVTIARKK